MPFSVQDSFLRRLTTQFFQMLHEERAQVSPGLAEQVGSFGGLQVQPTVGAGKGRQEEAICRCMRRRGALQTLRVWPFVVRESTESVLAEAMLSRAGRSHAALPTLLLLNTAQRPLQAAAVSGVLQRTLGWGVQVGAAGMGCVRCCRWLLTAHLPAVLP